MTADGSGRFELIVFDFDGTLCDSADLKARAFFDLYRDEQGDDFANRVGRYHLENAGVSRYDKIRHIEEVFLGTPPSDERVGVVAERFSSIVEDAVVAAPLFDGVATLLTSKPDGVVYTIASATPTEELVRIIERKNMGEPFAAVEGSPQSKATIISSFSDRFSVAPSNIAMIGDQPSDADAAREAGVAALMIANPGHWIQPFDRVDTFAEAALWLQSRSAL